MADLLLVEIEEVLAKLRRSRLAALRAGMADAGVHAGGGEEAFEDGSDDRVWVRSVLLRHDQPADPVTVDMIVSRAARDLASSFARGLTIEPSARRFLETAAAGARVVIVTRLDRQTSDRMLTLTGLADLTSAVITGDDVLEPKPSPEGYLAALGRFSRRSPIAPRSLALEGSRAGIRAARAANIPVVAVGDLSPEHAMEADGYVDSLDGQTVESLRALAAGRSGASS